MGVPPAISSLKPGHDDRATIRVIVTSAGRHHAPPVPGARRASLNCHRDPARQGSRFPEDKTEAQGHGAAERPDSTCIVSRCAGRLRTMNESSGAADLGLGPPNQTPLRDWSINCITFHGLPARSSRCLHWGKPFRIARIFSTNSGVSWLPPSTRAGPDICVLLDVLGITMTARWAGICAVAMAPATEVGLCSSEGRTVLQARVTAHGT